MSQGLTNNDKNVISNPYQVRGKLQWDFSILV